jgi:carbonic anhydrase
VKRILDGLSRFQNEVFPEERELFGRLATGQSPETLFITCSDSTIVPDLITQTKPGDLFICRNAGNIVPHYGETMGGVSATIEYAVMALNVKDIIICGHSDCGAMKGVLHREKTAGMPSFTAWLRHAEIARFILNENYENLSEKERLDVLIEENVIAQVDNLRTHPSVASRLMRDRVNLHGWVYTIETGEVKHLDRASRKFVRLGAAKSKAAGKAGERIYA